MVQVDSFVHQQATHIFVVDHVVVDVVLASTCASNQPRYCELRTCDLGEQIGIVLFVKYVSKKYPNRRCAAVAVFCRLVDKFREFAQSHLLCSLSKNKKQTFYQI